ncbi:MAG TPA: glycosyltransferase [Jatrophihabitantaceae bacterium]|nr:glycosyltransferase [Jatrophihabitantaceae bacterium]
MRIGLIAPPWVPVPPPRYGGTEVVVDNLARGLHARGHDVELFTVGESTCPVRRDFLYPSAREPMGMCVDEAAHVVAAYEALAHVDLIHDHTVVGPLLASQRHPRGPVVTTHHGPFTPEHRRILEVVSRSVPVIAISRDQARHAREVRIAEVIHHGIDLTVHQFGPGDGGYLLFVGRMSADKGIDRAIKAANRAGIPLVLATKMREPAEVQYYQEVVKPMMDRSVELIIEPSQTDRVDLMRRAFALINPIDWPEPFGLVMVEALACGTPVIASPRGAAPEIVDHGHTGYLCSDNDGLVDAVRHVTDIDRRACRAAAERHFSLARMARDHDVVYRRILASAPNCVRREPRLVGEPVRATA